jgi:Transposase IS116/IS110/IS902 family
VGREQLAALPQQLATSHAEEICHLHVAIALEIGDFTRFPTAEKLASYAGCTCRVHATGRKLRYGRLRPDVNRYLKWAFIEAANAICLMRRHPQRHVSRLYERIAGRKGRPSEGHRRRGSASRGSHVLASQQTGTVLRAAGVTRFVLPEARVLIATSPGMAIMPLRRRRYSSGRSGLMLREGARLRGSIPASPGSAWS